MVLVDKGNVIVYHRNPATSDLWDAGTKLQKINPANYSNPLANRTFGFAMNGPRFMVSGKSLQSAKDTTHYFTVRTHTVITSTLAEWTTAVESGLSSSLATKWSTTFSNHLLWWNAFWARSYITLPTARFETAQNYALQRFVNACQGRGNYPAKFNGGLFTPNDGRDWGGGYWMQNTRHIYWPALVSGDIDLIQPFLKMYLDLLPIRKEATQSQFGHAGAYFPETIMAWGLWRDWDYNTGVHVNGWIDHAYNGNLEYVAFLLDYVAFTQDTDFLQKKVIPFATEMMLWWDLHWPRKNGKLFITANANETYWNVTNPSCDVAGLQWVLDHLIALPVNMVPTNVRSAWVKLRAEVPELPTFVDNGQKRLNYFEGADRTPQMQNEENPELYAIFPYRIYGVGKTDLTTGVQSFLNRRQLIPSSDWSPDAIQAAYLGLTDDAWSLTSQYLKSGVDRFPMFFDWGDGFPEWCSGNIGANALQTILMQTEGDSIVLFPAWKPEWDVCFKLHAPKNTTVEGCLESGKLGPLTVTPQARGKDVSSHIAVGGITLSAKPLFDSKNLKHRIDHGPKISISNQVKIVAPTKTQSENSGIRKSDAIEFNLNGKMKNYE